MKINDNIRALRIENNLTQKQFGQILGVSTVSVNNWESGAKTPSASTIASISSHFSVSADSILGLNEAIVTEKPMTKHEALLLNDYRLLDRYGKQAVRLICSVEKARCKNECLDTPTSEQAFGFSEKVIPLYDSPSAAGIAAPSDNDCYSLIPINKDYETADFAVKISGNSMYPVINDGDIVYVKRTDVIPSGKIGIFSVDGASFCKRYSMSEDGSIELLSENPDCSNSNIYIDKNSNISVKCYGLVLSHR